MQEIKPEDVERLIGEGKLHFGDELEFSGCGHLWTGTERFRLFDSHEKAVMPFGVTPNRWYGHARFPRPDLRDGDPVFVRKRKDECYRRRHFKGFGENGVIMAHEEGRTAWSSINTPGAWKNWRIPTKEELSEAGLDPNWYEGRRGINQCDTK